MRGDLPNMARSVLLPALVVCSGSCAIRPSFAPGADQETPSEPVWTESFEGDHCLDRFTFTDPSAWRLTEVNGSQLLELLATSRYSPPHRSPLNIALIEGVAFRNFTLDVDVVQTGREYGHRDLCFFFGFQNPARMYYVHIASKADPNAHNIFLVNDAPRKSFAESTTEGIQWGEGIVHHVRIERDVDAATITVYFDDMETPIMRALDSTFDWGHIGFGSFDDVGQFDNIRISQTQMKNDQFQFANPVSP